MNIVKMENNMRIKNIKFEGFKANNRFSSVDFSNKNVTVIYGDNGSGKTTFLKAIYSFLSQDEDSLLSLGVSRVECEIEEDEQVHRVSVSSSEEGFDWRAFEESPLVKSKSLSLGVERGVSTQAMKIDPEILYDFFAHPKWRHELFGDRDRVGVTRKRLLELSEELSYFLRRRNAARFRHRRPEIDFEKNHIYLQSIKIENIQELLLRRYRVARFAATKKIQSALFDTLSVAIDIDSGTDSNDIVDESNFSERLVENKERIIEALDDGEDNNFKNRIVDILSKIDQPEELKKVLDHSLLSQLFKNMIDELEVEKLILSSINLLVERFNDYLIDDKKLVVNGAEVYIEIDGGRHSVNDLSSGERHILTFLSLVLFEGSDRHFLIIDEPEISLNIKWQRELMGIFSELLPKTQIIVASHSPALAKRNPDFLSELKVWRESNG